MQCAGLQGSVRPFHRRQIVKPQFGDPIDLNLGGGNVGPLAFAGYVGLHQQGFAHSTEVWLDGQLVGGAYGVCIGRMFYGESMFARVTDASKIALAHLVFFLRKNDVEMIDCQQQTAHLASLGAKPISRSEFILHLQQAIAMPPILDWTTEKLFTK